MDGEGAHAAVNGICTTQGSHTKFSILGRHARLHPKSALRETWREKNLTEELGMWTGRH